jgi:hypothetical protein
VRHRLRPPTPNKMLRSKLTDQLLLVPTSLHVAPASNIATMFEAETFDFIIMTNTVASYVGSPHSILSDCRHLLTMNGSVFASFINATSLRRFLLRKSGAIERFSTRGAPSSSAVRAVVINKRQLLSRCRSIGLQVRLLRYQSVLGGVAEKTWMIPGELMLSSLFPSLGHSINILAQRV